MDNFEDLLANVIGVLAGIILVILLFGILVFLVSLPFILRGN